MSHVQMIQDMGADLTLQNKIGNDGPGVDALRHEIAFAIVCPVLHQFAVWGRKLVGLPTVGTWSKARVGMHCDQ